jgi:hypothetical protein
MLFQDRVNSLRVLAGIGRRGENPVAGELLFLPRFLRILRPATIL